MLIPLFHRLDQFEKIQRVLLKDFEYHIKRGMASHSLNYKMVCANLSAIHQALEKEGQERVVLLDYSLTLAFGMLQSLMSVMTKDLQYRDIFGQPLFSEAKPSEEASSNECWMWLPYMRVFMDWMLHSVDVWRYYFTEPSLSVPDTVSKIVRNYFWKDFASLFNTLSGANLVSEGNEESLGVDGIIIFFSLETSTLSLFCFERSSMF
jgi:hypothetical protein